VAVNLIFDMHDEYAFGKESEDGVFVKGLTQFFGRSQVLVYSLDKSAAARGGGRGVDRTIQVGLNQIEAGDVTLLAQELNLRGTAEATIGLLEDMYKEAWLLKLVTMKPEELDLFCTESGAHPASVAALQRALKRLQRKEYVVEQGNFNLIDEMVQALDNGQNVIIHFGKHDSPLDHMLVANLVTRRVRELYRTKVERYEQTQNRADKPRPLMITIEEAHSFLSPAVSRQTIFGTIARELRKYHVTLMVVDQRPSSIDDEVLSQLGTRVSGKLTEERDIDAALTGVANRSFLRGALESLDTREQVLLMGHAVPMPIVVRTRKYDEAFYQAMTADDSGDRPKTANEAIAELYDF
jgi:DNA helicase HerA-like ATPase